MLVSDYFILYLIYTKCFLATGPVADLECSVPSLRIFFLGLWFSTCSVILVAA